VKVVGDSEFAENAKKEVRRSHMDGATVWYGPPPSHGCDLDIANVWLVDRMLRIEAAIRGVDLVSSTYTQLDIDMPLEIQDHVSELRKRGVQINGDQLAPMLRPAVFIQATGTIDEVGEAIARPFGSRWKWHQQDFPDIWFAWLDEFWHVAISHGTEHDRGDIPLSQFPFCVCVSPVEDAGVVLDGDVKIRLIFETLKRLNVPMMLLGQGWTEVLREWRPVSPELNGCTASDGPVCSG